MRYLLLILIGFSYQSQANSGASNAAAVAGAVAGASAASYQLYRSSLPKDLESWVNPKTGTAAEMNLGCGLVGEARLLGVNRSNRAFIGIFNDSKDSIVVNTKSITAAFESGRERRLLRFLRGAADGIQQNALEIKPNWYAWLLLDFPQKSDFKNQNSIEFKIPTVNTDKDQSCDLSIALKKDPSTPVDVSEYTPSTIFDMNIDFGGVIGRSGEFKKLGSGGEFAWAFTLAFFNSLNHGLFFTGVFEDNSPQNSVFSGTRASSFDDPTSRMTVGAFGYTHRRVLTDNMFLQFQIGYSSTSIEAREEFDTAEDFRYYSLYTQVAYDWVIKRVLTGFWTGDYGIGFGVYNYYVPSQEDEGLEINGSSTGALIRLKAGI